MNFSAALLPRVFASAMALSVAWPAHAANPAYVGTWGISAAQCRLGQDVQGAPLVMRAKGFDQHEAHCAFTSVKRSGNGWNVRAACAVEGDKQAHRYTLKVAGDVLTMTQGGVSRSYQRCR